VNGLAYREYWRRGQLHYAEYERTGAADALAQAVSALRYAAYLVKDTTVSHRHSFGGRSPLLTGPRSKGGQPRKAPPGCCLWSGGGSLAASGAAGPRFGSRMRPSRSKAACRDRPS
jgi:hypothetical protein